MKYKGHYQNTDRSGNLEAIELILDAITAVPPANMGLWF
jgi:hypothetical protein